jgi:hypothetical protein
VRGAGHGGLGLGFRRGWPDRGGQRKLLGEEEERILSKGDDGESPRGEEAESKMGERMAVRAGRGEVGRGGGERNRRSL